MCPRMKAFCSWEPFMEETFEVGLSENPKIGRCVCVCIERLGSGEGCSIKGFSANR